MRFKPTDNKLHFTAGAASTIKNGEKIPVEYIHYSDPKCGYYIDPRGFLVLPNFNSISGDKDERMGLYIVNGAIEIDTLTNVETIVNNYCRNTVISASSVVITGCSVGVSLLAGATRQLTATVSPIGSLQTGTWSSSDPLVATVSNTGLVTGIIEGTTTITFTTTDSGLTTTCAILVAADAPAPGVGPAAVDFGTATNYRVLTEAGVTNTGTSAITGDMGTSPIAASGITGFALTLDGGGTFSTSAQVTGNVYAADYSAPTPATLNTAIIAKDAAYVDAMGRTAWFTNYNSGNLGGQTLSPGVYNFTTGVTIPTNLTLTGGANDTWIFQVNGTLGLAAATNIILAGGAVASNVIWATTGTITIGAAATFRGIAMSATNIALGDSAVVSGRLFAGTAVTLDDSTVGA